MKLSRTVGLAVAVPLLAGAVAAFAQISRAAPADPTANVVDAAGHLRVPADYQQSTKRLGAGRLLPRAAKARSKSTPSTHPRGRSTPTGRRGTSRTAPFW